MNKRTPEPPMLTANLLETRQTATKGEVANLEQQMAELGLSRANKRFLRNLHLVEKQLNDAFEKAHQGGDLEQQVSQVYRELYRPD